MKFDEARRESGSSNKHDADRPKVAKVGHFPTAEKGKRTKEHKMSRFTMNGDMLIYFWDNSKYETSSYSQ